MKSQNPLASLYTILFALCLLVATPALVQAVGPTLAWDPPTENADGSPLTDLAGYKVYYGTTSGTYTESIDVGNQTTHTVPDLSTGQYYFFATTAYDSSDNESGFSVELAWSSTPPEAQNDNYSVDEDASLSRNAGNGVLANDTDFESDPLTAALVSDVAHGVLSLNSDGSFTYTPEADFSGSDSFTYRANDGDADSTVATVALVVNAVNDTPAADDHASSTDEDTSVVVNLSGSDGDGDALTFTLVDAPAHGTISGSAPNVTYTPDPNYHGADSFTYQANDGSANSAVATVSLTVNPVNDTPVADDGDKTTLEDVPTSLVLSGSDIDGDTLSFVIVAAPSNGTLSGTAPNLTYTPEENFSGSDSFTYRVNDGSANSPIATFALTVVEVDDTPPAPPTNLRAEAY